MVTLEIDHKEFWYLPTSHTWHGDDKRIREALQKTLPLRWSGIHKGVPFSSDVILHKALKSFPHARVKSTTN